MFLHFITEHSNDSIQLPTTSNNEPSTSYERLQMDNELNAAAYQTLGNFMKMFPLFICLKHRKCWPPEDFLINCFAQPIYKTRF